ncbi:MAG: polysaccharide biosynthesis/export family protein [Cyclobacteriaceae bacterium]
MSRIKPLLLPVLFFLLIGVSCVPVRRVAYVQSDTQTIFHGEPADIKIRPGDELYIRISSADEQPTNVLGDATRGINDPTLLSYTVDEEGNIRLPHIGKTNVNGLTLEEAAENIEKGLADYLYMPSVYIRFINTKVTVLGEVNRPGVYMFDYKNINILQAIGYAGDIGQYGNRRNILIIREDGGIRQKYYVDLTRGNILESELYNLNSGDIVFVEPLGRKKWGLATVPYNLIISLITTGLFVYTFVQNNLINNN